MDEYPTRDSLYGFEFRDVDNRRSPADERKVWDIKQMWQRSHEIVNLAAQGYKNVEIANILNIHPATVSSTINGELGKRKLSELRFGRDEEAKRTTEKIRVLTDKALATYHEIFDNEHGEYSAEDKRKTADTILLELSGLRAPTRIQSQHISTQLTAEELEEFKRRGRAAAASTGINIPKEDD